MGAKLEMAKHVIRRRFAFGAPAQDYWKSRPQSDFNLIRGTPEFNAT